MFSTRQLVGMISEQPASMTEPVLVSPTLPPQLHSTAPNTTDTIDYEEKIKQEKAFKQQIMDVVAILIFSGFVIGFCIIAAEDFG